MKKALIIFVFFALFVLAATILSGFFQGSCVKVDEDRSYFSEFEVTGEEVHIECFVTLTNCTSRETSVRLTALLTEDVSLGLLEEPECPGVDKHTGNPEFTVPAHSSAAFHVVFTGGFAGVDQKSNRLLPEIIIIPVTGDSD